MSTVSGVQALRLDARVPSLTTRRAIAALLIVRGYRDRVFRLFH